MVRLLGTASDAEVGRRLRISRTIVMFERRRRGIPAFHPHREPFVWDDRALALLGTMSDRDVAAELGLKYHSVVRNRRRLLGIPSFAPPPHTRRIRKWRRREEALLGTMPDRELAVRLGCATVVVSHRRRALGVPAFRPAPPRVRWSRHHLSRLGKVSDEALAREMGITMIAVNLKRRSLGIPRFRENGAVRSSPELRRLLREPTNVVRERTGLGRTTIARLRAQHGISERNVRTKPRGRGIRSGRERGTRE